PLARGASPAATTPKRAPRPIILRLLRWALGIKGVMSNSATSPATCTGSDDVSKLRIGPTPLRPLTQADQNASLPTPLGATTPTPVTTTLRMASLSGWGRPHISSADARTEEDTARAPDRWGGACSGFVPVWLFQRLLSGKGNPRFPYPWFLQSVQSPCLVYITQNDNYESMPQKQ